MTAILKFFDNELNVPGEWFGLEGNIFYEDLPDNTKRGISMTTSMGFSEGKLGSLEEEALVFELINFGGVPQGESDI